LNGLIAEGEKMSYQENQSQKETKRKENCIAEEAKRTDEEQVRQKIYLAREQEIEKAQKAKETKRTENRSHEEIKELAKVKARKEEYLVREKMIAEAQEARKIKDAKK
jgi:hypothetical protein